LEYGIFELWNRSFAIGQNQRKSRIFEADVYGFSAAVLEIYDLLSEAGKRDLRRRLRGGIRQGGDLRDLRLECDVYTHITQIGLGILPFENPKGKGFDFLVANSDFEAELEVKHISTHKGHKIHRGDFAKIGECFSTRRSLLEDIPAHRIALVTLVDRFPQDAEEQQVLIDDVLTAGVRGSSVRKLGYKIEVVEANKANIPSMTEYEDQAEYQEALRRAAEKQIGVENTSMCVAFAEKGTIFSVLFTSSEPTRYIQQIEKTIKEATFNQLSGTKPGFIIVGLEGIDRNSMESLREGRRLGNGHFVGLSALAYRVFVGCESQHLAGLAFLGDPMLCTSRLPDNHFLPPGATRSFVSERPVYSVANPRAQDHLGVFRAIFNASN